MANDKMLYVVTSGCYSDYGISAIFNDRELADRYCEGSDDSDGYGSRVEEFELNPGADRIRADLKTHTVQLDRDGNVIRHWESWGDGDETGKVDWRYRDVSLPLKRLYHFEAVIVAKTKEQAIKAANERRARWIADNHEWPDDEI